MTLLPGLNRQNKPTPDYWEPVLSGGIIVAFVLHTARKNSFSEPEQPFVWPRRRQQLANADAENAK